MAEAFSATCPLLKASNLILRWSTRGLVHVPCWWYWTSLNITFKWFWPRHRPCVISAGETGCAWIQWFQWNAALSNLDQWWSMMINCVYGISMVIRSFHGFWDVLQPHHLWLSCSIPFHSHVGLISWWAWTMVHGSSQLFVEPIWTYETSLMLKPIIGSSNPRVFLDEIMKSRVFR